MTGPTHQAIDHAAGSVTRARRLAAVRHRRDSGRLGSSDPRRRPCALLLSRHNVAFATARRRGRRDRRGGYCLRFDGREASGGHCHRVEVPLAVQARDALSAEAIRYGCVDASTTSSNRQTRRTVHGPSTVRAARARRSRRHRLLAQVRAPSDPARASSASIASRIRAVGSLFNTSIHRRNVPRPRDARARNVAIFSAGDPVDAADHGALESILARDYRGTMPDVLPRCMTSDSAGVSGSHPSVGKPASRASMWH